ncbi:hypothetical protein X566_17670 [Afipia sp. P52-10]|uniref:hypothetical protein n=1 Tax=Afipia sp. P52-10 TaxID=1429916 RepID=UPI0003DF1452|nr:hypothetical protein [Afipia sp. P52-10]ETR76365.1 hypothetical protein X566_17670 [Afipia sp. P52-10]
MTRDELASFCQTTIAPKSNKIAHGGTGLVLELAVMLRIRSLRSALSMHDAAVALHLTELSRRLDNAAELGRAAAACLSAGSHAAALDVAMDIEQLLYETTTLLNAASLLHRMED